MEAPWGDDAVERYRRMRVVGLIFAGTLVASILGLIFVTFYEAFSAGHSLYTTWRDVAHNLIRDRLPRFLFAFAIFLAHLFTRPLRQWYFPPLEEPLPREPTPTAQREALRLPLLIGSVVFITWSLRGIILFLDLQGEQAWLRLVSNVMAGAIAGTISHFAAEAIWQHEVPLFFPEGHLTLHLRPRFSIRIRMLFIFATGIIAIIYLGVVTYSWARRIPTATEPQAMVHRLLQVEVLIVVAAITTAVVLAATMGETLVYRLKHVQGGLRRVQRGELAVQLKIHGDDEINDLAASFNKMIQSLRAQEETRKLLNSYVSPEVANYALHHGAEQEGELTEATILFSDIRSFTSLAEALTPAQTMALLNRYFQAMEGAVRAYGGIINKFIGDSLMAIFGTPINRLPNHAESAVWAAVELLRTLRLFNEEQERRGEPTLRAGVGIASGLVVAGNVGGTERFEYTVIGNTVNVASRLESLTKTMGKPILLSAETAKAVADAIPLRLLGEVHVRGKHDLVTVFTVDLPICKEAYRDSSSHLLHGARGRRDDNPPRRAGAPAQGLAADGGGGNG